MHLYRGSVGTLRDDLAQGSLISRLEETFREQFLYSVGPSEITSWERSLAAAGSVLADASLDEAEVLVEYRLPLTSKRIDVLVIGHHPAGGISAVVVENKQWTVGEIEDLDERTVRVAGRTLLHPQQQVAQYVDYLKDFNSLAHDGRLKVSGLAFLHNATSAQAAPLRAAGLAEVADYPIFTSDELGRMRDFLGKAIVPVEAAKAADEFLAAPTQPSKPLLAHVQHQIQGQPAFTLLDEQLVAYDVVVKAVEESRRSNTKKVVVILGGPGTGKSVIAVQLLSDLARQERNVSHATGSKSFTTTLRHRVGPKAGRLFRYFNNFTEADANELDALVADEAHRIRDSSNTRFTAKSGRSSRGMRICCRMSLRERPSLGCRRRRTKASLRGTRRAPTRRRCELYHRERTICI